MRGARQRSHLRRCTRARRQAAKAQCDAGVRSRMAKRRRGKHTPFVIWDRHAIARAAHAPNGIRPAAQAENRSSLRRSEGPFCLINRSKSLRCRPLPGLLRRDFRPRSRPPHVLPVCPGARIGAVPSVRYPKLPAGIIGSSQNGNRQDHAVTGFGVRKPPNQRGGTPTRGGLATLPQPDH